MRRGSSGEYGSYLLELVGVVTGITFLALGASDVARVFHARSTLRAAVNEGTRCIYPTDAGCLNSESVSPASVTRRFDVYLQSDQGYSVPQDTYSASANFYEEPVYEVQFFQDRVSEVTLEQSPFRYGVRDVLFPVTANAPYLLQTRTLPVIGGGAPFAPQFVDPVSRQVAPVTARYPISDIGGTTTREVSSNETGYESRFRIGAVTFRVSDAWPSRESDLEAIRQLPQSVQRALPCYYGSTTSRGDEQSIDWRNGGPAACAYRYNGGGADSSEIMSRGQLRVPLMFRVTGAPGERSNRGKVTMSMSWKSPSGELLDRRLGGRIVDEGSPGNFVPRGLAKSDIPEELLADYREYWDELDLHGSLPLVPIDAEVTIEFFLSSTAGREVEWRGQELQVFLPQYRFVHEKHSCGYSKDPAACVKAPRGVPVAYLAVDRDIPLKAQGSSSDWCSVTKDQEAQSKESVLSVLQDAIRHGKKVAPTRFLEEVDGSGNVCPAVSKKHQCAITGPKYPKGCEPESLPEDGAELLKRCGIPVPTDTSFRVVDIQRGSELVGSQTYRACTDDPLPACANLSQSVKKDSLPIPSSVSCGAREAVPVQEFFGPLYRSTCEEDINKRKTEIAAMYRAKRGIPEDVEITVARIELPESENVYNTNQPANACVPSTPLNDEQPVLCGRGLSEAEANACCALKGVTCSKRIVEEFHHSTTTGSGGTLLEMAKQRVVGAVRAAYPSSKSQITCGAADLDCLAVDVSLGQATESSGRRAVVTATMNLPLPIIGALNGGKGSVQYMSSRQLEKEAIHQ